MADNSNTILNQLQQYIAEPPDGAFEKAWQHIVQHKIITAGNQLLEEENKEEERKVFTRLQDHHLPAPALDFNAITNTTVKPATKKRSLLIPLRYARVASVILIIAAAGILYFTLFRKKETAQNNYVAAAKRTDSSNANINNDAVKSTAKETAVAGTGITEAQTNLPVKTVQKKTTANKDFTIVNKKSNANSNIKSISSEGQLYENDMLFTLVNYKSLDCQNFYTKALTEKKITLNKYSYHNLSDKMVELLQDMYLVKNNGKPSRKAKKTKKKFEKWRKKDEKYFDKDLEKNPADIIDFSEFILKK